MRLSTFDQLLTTYSSPQESSNQEVMQVENLLASIANTEAALIVQEWCSDMKTALKNGIKTVFWDELIDLLQDHQETLQLLRTNVEALAQFESELENEETTPMPPSAEHGIGAISSSSLEQIEQAISPNKLAS